MGYKGLQLRDFVLATRRNFDCRGAYCAALGFINSYLNTEEYSRFYFIQFARMEQYNSAASTRKALPILGTRSARQRGHYEAMAHQNDSRVHQYSWGSFGTFSPTSWAAVPRFSSSSSFLDDPFSNLPPIRRPIATENDEVFVTICLSDELVSQGGETQVENKERSFSTFQIHGVTQE